MTALYYVHSFGVIHRDIKPENIMMFNPTEDSDIRLVDFGLSKIMGPNEKCTENYGTLNYIAPEVLLDQPYDMSADSWSLGIVVYLLITGCLPFDDVDQREVIRQIIYDPVPFPKYIWTNYSQEAKSFVNSLLQRDPSKRMNMMEALEHSWIKKHEKINIENALGQTGQITKHLSDFQKYTHVITDSDIKDYNDLSKPKTPKNK